MTAKGHYIIICQSICPADSLRADSLKTNRFWTGQKESWVGPAEVRIVGLKGELMGRLVWADTGLWEWLDYGPVPAPLPVPVSVLAQCVRLLLGYLSASCAKQLRQVDDTAKSSSCFNAVPSCVCPQSDSQSILYIRSALTQFVACGYVWNAQRGWFPARVSSSSKWCRWCRTAQSGKERERETGAPPVGYAATGSGVAGSVLGVLAASAWQCAYSTVDSGQWTAGCRLPAACCALISSYCQLFQLKLSLCVWHITRIEPPAVADAAAAAAPTTATNSGCLYGM